MEISQALTILSSVRATNSSPEQIVAASAFIQKEYPKITLGELQQIIIDGIMQKFNNTSQPQYNDMPTLMFWLKLYWDKNKPGPTQAEINAEKERDFYARL